MRGTVLLAACGMLALACGGGASNTNESSGTSPKDPGASIYNSRCTMCHGRGGNLGMSGAKDLTKSTLTKEEMIAVVTNGKGGMIGFGKMLSKEEINAVVDHVRTLHARTGSDEERMNCPAPRRRRSSREADRTE